MSLPREELSLDLDGCDSDADIDFVLIDGPVEALAPRGREGALYMASDLLRVGALIALDDYHRRSANRVVRNWRGYYGENLEIVDDNEERIILMRKMGEQEGRSFPGLRPLLDNYFANAMLQWQRIKRSRKSAAWYKPAAKEHCKKAGASEKGIGEPF